MDSHVTSESMNSKCLSERGKCKEFSFRPARKLFRAAKSAVRRRLFSRNAVRISHEIVDPLSTRVHAEETATSRRYTSFNVNFITLPLARSEINNVPRNSDYHCSLIIERAEVEIYRWLEYNFIVRHIGNFLYPRMTRRSRIVTRHRKKYSKCRAAVTSRLHAFICERERCS